MHFPCVAELPVGHGCEGRGRRGSLQFTPGTSRRHVTDGCEISFDLGNKISKLTLSQTIAYLMLSPHITPRKALLPMKWLAFVCNDKPEHADLAHLGAEGLSAGRYLLGLHSAWIAKFSPRESQDPIAGPCAADTWEGLAGSRAEGKQAQ